MLRPLLPLMLAWLALSAAPALRAEPGAPMRAERLLPGETLRLDGSLAHPAWQRAPVHAGFVETTPDNGAAPVQATQVQVLFDERALWVGITVHDTAPERIREVLVRADQVNRTQDFVVVYVDPIGSRQAAQFFRVNAAGSTADGLHTAADDSEDFAPDFDWDAATQRTPAGWTAVLRLPFASLRFAEGVQDWRIMVARRLPREQFHLLASTPIPRDAPSFIATLQPLQGVALPEQHAFLTLRPSITLRTRDDGQGGPGSRRNDADTSLDVKWRPRAELVVDATLNPDFSQVALDVPQLAGNTRFALSFPEKRPFFFESADLLRSPTEAFYTRSFTEPRWGLRSTWRGPLWSGSGFVVDDRGGGVVLLPGAYGTDAVAQPGSRTLALRLRGNQDALQLGALASTRRYDDGAGSNDVLGADAGWQIDGAWRARAQWLHSRTDAFTGPSAGAGGTAAGPQQDGDRLYGKLWRLTDNSEFNIELDDITRGFRQDTGFVAQAGARRVSAFGSRTWRGLGPFNDFALNLQLEHTRERSSGETVLQDWRPGLYANAARNLEWWFELHPGRLLRVDAGRPLLRERYVETGLVMTPARWFPLLETTLASGRLADTQAEVVRPGLRWNTTAWLRPLPRLELEPSVSVAWLKQDGTRMYRETVAQALAVWHFDARHNLRAIWQRVALDRRAEATVEAQRERSSVGSLTYTWRHSAGTLLYVGASRARAGDAPAATEAFVKLQFDTEELRSAVAGS